MSGTFKRKRRSEMKRLVAVLLIALLAGSSLWAVDDNKIIVGADAMGAGAILIALPLVFDWDAQTTTVMVVSGAILGGLGLAVFIAGLVADDPSYAQAVEDNPILKHVSLGTTGEQTYVGLRFRF
jgi:hypothetical protein